MPDQPVPAATPGPRRFRRAVVLLAGLVPGTAAAAEVCRYAGAASHDGQVSVRAEVAAAGDTVTVDVALALTATSLWVFDVRYLAEEISTWRAGELQGVATNIRSVVDGRVIRQTWDVFRRGAGGGLEAYRVQGKRPAEFRRRHPGFAGHWDPDAFGRPWLADFAAAAPERRPDLDLPVAATAPGLRTPLALAFHWSRVLPPAGGDVPVFLPGFKRDARAEVPVRAATPGPGWRAWQAAVRHPALAAGVPSGATAWVGADGRLLQLAFEVHARQGSARGVLRPQGCEGAAAGP